ncbi:hypothetical protein ENUP19_0112G0031 [Entamoeba nuttalli]|uniref:Uncharacterized protein n=1 Tax=Entamoeba nuttalli TaxID=412467 RepID=A0ABQ0DI99_9EUKA
MFGTRASNDRNNSSEETEFEHRTITLTDLAQLLNELEDVGNMARILSEGIKLSFEGYPLYTFNRVINRHIELVEKLNEHTSIFRKNNRLIIEELKKEEEREEREDRIDRLEKKKEEETKPERRKTRPL